MAHTDGIHTYFFQVSQTALPYLRRNYCSQYTSIMMQTYSFHLHPLSVQGKSLIGIKLQCTETYIRRTAIYPFPVTKQLCLQRVQIRCIQIPAARFLHLQCYCFFRNTFSFIRHFLTVLCYQRTFCIIKCRRNLQCASGLHMFLYFHIDCHYRLLIGQRSSVPTYPPLSKMNVWSGNHPHIPVNSRTSVPA